MTSFPDDVDDAPAQTRAMMDEQLEALRALAPSTLEELATNLIAMAATFDALGMREKGQAVIALSRMLYLTAHEPREG